MQQLFDFLFLGCFFLIYKFYGIYYATGSLAITSLMKLIYMSFRYQKIKKTALVVFLIVIISSLLTLYYHNEDFIKWKGTVVCFFLSIILLINQFIFKKPFIQFKLNKEIHLPIYIWTNLSILWAIFFFICGAINAYVAFYFSQNVWVNFKVFGISGLTLLFSLISGGYIYIQMKKNKNG
ncbi:inner membrane-spanning protein YciB [Sodalis sp. CWE]|uniref:inner membrane-spanning protein YciB n=1 Tax=Sodalis sp. CWE TaxID=2803816 RepID=UPI001C7D1EF2|nr:inner membrane-spanning protein YciB [Sodalis sp. CWE]MBX4181165.1 septation protein IspZ [Sodalis sp. CWE]